MASKSKMHGANIMHTAGIFSDMTVDGPEIGTLVVVVDRAKNLPDRKIIGKQNPYCAARLGKEAKKTDTDHRGGQTPKWDQELRYTVHDSPDYYQLKVSVFNDDKKTDLIGETKIDLRDIIVPGGGQNDLWHNLNCKGKYAGEVRVEITYYDTRPKQEKSETFNPDHDTLVNEAPRVMKPPKNMIKRRPLPSDPIIRDSGPGIGFNSSFPYNPDFEVIDQTPRPLGGYTTSPSSSTEQTTIEQRRYQTHTPVNKYEDRHHSFSRDQLRTSNSGSGCSKPSLYGFQTVPPSTEDFEQTQAGQREFQDSDYFTPKLPYLSREKNMSGYFSSNGSSSTRLNEYSNVPESQKLITGHLSNQPLNSQYVYPETRAYQANSRESFHPREKSNLNYIPYTKPYDYPSPEELGAPPSLSDSPPPPPIHRSGNSNKYRISLGYTPVPYVASDYVHRPYKD